MREEQSETTTEAAETVEETTSCKRQGHPRFRHTSSHLVRALKFTKSLSRRNKKQQHGGASAIDGIEVTLNEEDSDSAAAAEAAEKKEEKKSVTFAEEVAEEIWEEIREEVEEFEVGESKKRREMSRRHRRNNRMEHDDEDEADVDVSMYEEIISTILPCCKIMSTAAADDDSVLLTPTYM